MDGWMDGWKLPTLGMYVGMYVRYVRFCSFRFRVWVGLGWVGLG